MNLFEAGMLICFGAAWPTNIIKAYKSRSAKGQSLAFLLILELGYIFGIIFKFQTGVDLVFALYSLNFLMVFINMCLILRNRRIDMLSDSPQMKGFNNYVGYRFKTLFEQFRAVR